MTESGGLVRLLPSRSQHVSLSRLESSEVTKGTIVPFNQSAFFAIERLRLPLSARMQNIIIFFFSLSTKIGFYNTFEMIKQVFDCFGEKVNCKAAKG